MWWLLACAGHPPADVPLVADIACAPVADVPTGAVEGDTVSFEARCTGDPLYTVAIADGPPGASFDALSSTFEWTTGLADAGRHRVVLTFTPDAAHPAAAVERLEVVFDVADAFDAPGDAAIDPATYVAEFGLPVVDLETTGPITTDDVPSTVWIDGRSHAGTVHVRGAASSGYSKPGMTVQVDGHLDLDAWGLGHPDHLVLATTFDDNSYVRQKLSYDLWAAMAATTGDGRLTPRTAYVVVYVDGRYHGLFVAIDRIDDRFLGDMGLAGGGNIFKAIDHNANFRLTDVNGDPKVDLAAGYEQKQGTDASDLRELVQFVGTADGPTFAAGADAWLDRSEFIDWYLFVRFAAADDSGGKNDYLVHDPETGRFRYVPWDFNHSWGQDWRTLRFPPTVANDFRWNNEVFVHLQDDPGDAASIDARQARFVGGPFSDRALRAKLDAYYALIDPSARRDWSMWAADYQSYGGWASSRTDDWTDYDGEKAYVYAWVDARAGWAEADNP